MAEQQEPVHQTWLYRDTYLHGRFVRPAMRFLNTEASGGIVLLIAAAVALIWANSPWGDSYFTFWNTEVSIEVGDFFHIEETFKDLVNDGLMAIFFFVVGMEIKRELVVGELNEPRKAAMPVMAALGGMVVPALIYVGIVASNGGGEAMQGWGIPMATDIAFSVGRRGECDARTSWIHTRRSETTHRRDDRALRRRSHLTGEGRWCGIPLTMQGTGDAETAWGHSGHGCGWDTGRNLRGPRGACTHTAYQPSDAALANTASITVMFAIASSSGVGAGCAERIAAPNASAWQPY